MNLSLISVSRRARVLAVVAIFGSLTAIRSSLSAAEPRHEGSAVAGQRPHESPSTVFERDPAVELYVDLDLLARAVARAGSGWTGGRRPATHRGGADPAAFPQGGPDGSRSHAKGSDACRPQTRPSHTRSPGKCRAEIGQQGIPFLHRGRSQIARRR